MSSARLAIKRDHEDETAGTVSLFIGIWVTQNRDAAQKQVVTELPYLFRPLALYPHCQHPLIDRQRHSLVR
jgi:hypothetical protein